MSHQKFIGLIVSISTLAYLVWLEVGSLANHDSQKKYIQFQDSLRTGDIILTTGKSAKSVGVFLMEGANTSFTHVGILVRHNDSVFVIHANPNAIDLFEEGQVVREPMSDFLADPHLLDWHVLRSCIVENRNVFAVHAHEFVKRAIPFDPDFDWQSTDRLYCTELVYRVYELVGIPLLDVELTAGAIIYPSMISHSSWLEPVFWD